MHPRVSVEKSINKIQKPNHMYIWKNKIFKFVIIAYHAVPISLFNIIYNSTIFENFYSGFAMTRIQFYIA